MFNIVKYDLSAPLPTFHSSDKFQSMLGRIGLYYAQYTCSSPKPVLSQNVCMENELLRRQKSQFLELILLANAYQRWVVKEVLFLQFLFSWKSYSAKLCFSRRWIKPCQLCVAAAPERPLYSLSPLLANSRLGLGEWGQRQTGAAAPQCPQTRRQQRNEELSDLHCPDN